MILLAIGAAVGWRQVQQLVRDHPERFPWTELDLDDPIGRFTGMKLAALGADRHQCLGLLRSAGLSERPVNQPRASAPQCQLQDGVLIQSEGSGSIGYAPDGLVTSCPVAAALALWERDVVQPAARRHLGSSVVRIDHAGSFSCRRLYGRTQGPFSEHATADAIDIMEFRLADGGRISVLRDWSGDAEKRAFLREVRDGGCRLFSTVLSPDYNAAHADHFHLDLASRGWFGWRPCR